MIAAALAVTYRYLVYPRQRDQRLSETIQQEAASCGDTFDERQESGYDKLTDTQN